MRSEAFHDSSSPSRQSSCDAILSMPRGIGNGEFDGVKMRAGRIGIGLVVFVYDLLTIDEIVERLPSGRMPFPSTRYFRSGG